MSKRQVLAILATAVVVLGIALPAAWASGNFTWSCTFSHRCVSRTYNTPHTGTHTIWKYSASCPGPGTKLQMRVVHQEFGPDTFYAWKLYDCGATDQSRSWAIPQTGDFHFDIEKADTTDTSYDWVVSGQTFYP
jgi:hypothetical protein